MSVVLKPTDDRVVVRPPSSAGQVVRTGPPAPIRVVSPPPAPSTGIVVPGGRGGDGRSAYEVAVANGFIGTEEQWLESLAPSDVPDMTLLFENGLIG